MKIFYSLLSAFVLLSSSSAIATDLAPKGSAPRIGIELAEGDFDPNVAMAAYAQGTHGTEALLVGQWVLVGSALIIPEAMSGTIYPYTPEGVKNGDGSFFNQLDFRIETDFFGNRSFRGRVLNLGHEAEDQGPLPVQLGDSAGGSGKHRVITQNLFGGGGNPRIENQCRLLKGFPDRMICAGIYRADENHADELTKHIGQMIVVRGFMKKSP